MAQRILKLAAAAALAYLAVSKPTTKLYPSLQRRQSCNDQSCTIAALSGSSGVTYDPATTPVGGSDSGDCCIIGYNPSVATKLYQEKPALKSECAAKKLLKKSEPAPAPIEKRACTANTLLFARGTFESGTLGETVGPALKSGLASKSGWTVTGVTYDASIDGDDCLGLPGGVAGTKLLESTVASCPDTKIIFSGYSQGAMVAHNAVANASAEAQSHVVGVVVFGDPFDGAPIKGYSGPIKTYCASGDDVCKGEFSITLAHLSYVGADTTAAVAYMASLV